MLRTPRERVDGSPALQCLMAYVCVLVSFIDCGWLLRACPGGGKKVHSGALSATIEPWLEHRFVLKGTMYRVESLVTASDVGNAVDSLGAT